jgi:predicted flap endonuclease-1-like 5' DNA nuclease
VAVAAAAQEARIEADENTQELIRIKGLGPKLAATLGELGINRIEQIAAWTDADIDRIDAQLGRFQGRIRRDEWVEQARLLAAGDTAGFEGRFGAT